MFLIGSLVRGIFKVPITWIPDQESDKLKQTSESVLSVEYKQWRVSGPLHSSTAYANGFRYISPVPH